MKKPVFIIRPSSLEPEELLSDKLEFLSAKGWVPIYHSKSFMPEWPYCSASEQDRFDQLMEALKSKESHYIFCARGGYGASDLISLLPWKRLAKLPPKIFVGFSDVSALHSAFYTKLGWKGLHAPMLATNLWSNCTPNDDVETLLQGMERGNFAVKLPIRWISKTPRQSIEAKLFGGCFSVLTNLIGTPYFPKSLAGHAIFLEDIGENPGRLMRFFNQWLQSGALKGVRAILLGNFKDCCPPGREWKLIFEQFASRAGIPTAHCELFGHTSPNMPLMIGAKAMFSKKHLNWSLKIKESTL